MPGDDEPDEQFGFQQPLPPDDRLWRHPSELGAAGAAAPITIVERPRTAGRVWLAALAALIVGVGATFAGLKAAGRLDPPRRTAIEEVQVPVPKTADAEDLAVADQLGPSVVRVVATGHSSGGTGLIIRTDGIIVTSADAVDGADGIQVTFSDGQTTGGTLVGVDSNEDVAVIKVDRSGLSPATLGQPDNVALGERARVLYTSPDKPGTADVGVGLISAKGARLEQPSGHALHGLVQANVNVPPETTGAPLVDSRQAVVGLVTRRGSSADTTAGVQELEVRFAIPIDWVKRIADELSFTGKVIHMWLGIKGTDLTHDQRDQLGRGGAQVTSVAQGSPAEAAGLQPGDILTQIDDQPVSSISQLIVAVRMHLPGDTVSLTYLRAGDPQLTTATLTEEPAG